MKQHGWFAKLITGALLFVITPFALGACGPRVVAENENALVVKNGPWYPLSKAESKATKSKAKSDTSPATPEGQSIQHEFTKWYLYPCGWIQSGPLSPSVTEAD